MKPPASPHPTFAHRRWSALAIAGVAALALAGWGLWHRANATAAVAAPPVKSYTRVIAEGVRVRNPAAGVRGQCLSLKSCRIEKQRRGWLTLGAFNVLVLEDIVLTLPALPSAPGAANRPSAGIPLALEAPANPPSRPTLELLGPLFGDTLRPFLQPQVRISGLSIRGLQVNREAAGGCRLRLTAQHAEIALSGDRLRLSGSTLQRDGGEPLPLKKAVLLLQPELTVVYQASDDTITQTAL